ncbi:MAG TPA: S8 family serine peptidase [Anaerolineae bacterium]|nr:S8 family serine peptidase [Anaerolineae bacterium]
MEEKEAGHRVVVGRVEQASMFGLRRRYFLILLAFIVLLVTGFNPGVGSAHSGAVSDSHTGENLIAKMEIYEQLLPRVQAQGTLRVIIRLEMPFLPEALHSSAYAILAQRYRIQQVQSTVLDSLSAYSVATAQVYVHVPYLALEIDGTALWDLILNPLVATIQEDVPVPPTLLESIPLIGAAQAWALGATGQGQVIAVLDTGVDASHPFLAGKVAAEACFSTTYAGLGSTTLCPNGQQEQIGQGAAVHCTAGGCEHGTHIAGIAAGKGGNRFGVALDAEIIAVQVFSHFGPEQCRVYGYSGDCVLSYTSDQISALEWVYEQRLDFAVAAVNMSLGGNRYTSGCDSDPRKPIIDTLREHGIATVVSSGNGGYVDALAEPACISSTISVGSTTDGDALSSFSNHSRYLDLLAPGSSIISSVPGGRYQTWTGTSMSAPHVAGAWALFKSAYPDASVDEILAALTSTGIPIRDTRPGGSITKPRIRLGLALLELQNQQQPTATPTITTTPSPTATSSPTPTSTHTPTPTMTHTPTATATSTATATPILTATPTATSTAEPRPAGETLWYLAEGYTGDGVETFILVQNPNPEPATVFLTYQLQDGGELVRQHVVGPLSRYTIAAHDESEVGQDAAFSTLITSDLPVIVERALYFANGGHNSMAVTQPSTIWYLAEGYTGEDFSTYILIQNPNQMAATVRLRYLLQGGGIVEREHPIEAHSRHTVVAAHPDEVGPDQAFSIIVESDLPVIVERSMYFPSGGHNTFGVTHPQTTWVLAEGSSQPGYATYILILNPQQHEVALELTYWTQDGGTVTREHTVPALSRTTIAAGLDTEAGADQVFAARIQADAPVVVERAMYFLTGGSCAVGASRLARSWSLAEGYTGEGFETDIAVQNPHDQSAILTITYMIQDGTPIQREHFVPAHSRYTIHVHDPAELGLDVAFSTYLTSDLPVMVDRSMFFLLGGHLSGALPGED